MIELELLERVKDLLCKVMDGGEDAWDNSEISAAQANLSAIRTKLSQLDRAMWECQLRQNVYAEMANKVLQTALNHRD